MVLLLTYGDWGLRRESNLSTGDLVLMCGSMHGFQGRSLNTAAGMTGQIEPAWDRSSWWTADRKFDMFT